MADYTYAGTKSTPSVSGNKENGTVTYYYNTSNSNSGGTAWSTVTSSTSLNVGTYYMYATIGATSNYNAYTTAAKAFTVKPATIEYSVTMNSLTYNGSQQQAISAATVSTPGRLPRWQLR